MTVHEDRLRALIDPEIMDNDAWYHAQVACFRTWLNGAQMAMEDEDVEPETVERVLNRMVYGVPYSGVGYERQGQRKAMIDVLENCMAPKVIVHG